MKRFAFLLAALLALPAFAQGIDVGAERKRITEERKQADTKYAAEQKDCRAKFAVTDCLAKARARHRDVVTELRRQEVTLNDLERRRRAAEKMKDLDERQAEQKKQAADRKRESAAKQHEERAADQAQRAARKASEVHTPRAPREPKVHDEAARAAEAEKNRVAYDKRMKEAEEHRLKAQKRREQHKKPPAAPLPPPAGS